MPVARPTTLRVTKPLGIDAKGWFVRVVIIAALLVAIGIGVCVFIGISTSLQAEKTLHAIGLVTVVVDRFIQKEHRWPKSWEDLRTVSAGDRTSAMYSWPDDVEVLQRRVMINFDADLKTIASQTIDDFDAIQPIGPCYSYKHYGYIRPLIETIRALVDRQKASSWLGPSQSEETTLCCSPGRMPPQRHREVDVGEPGRRG